MRVELHEGSVKWSSVTREFNYVKIQLHGVSVARWLSCRVVHLHVRTVKKRVKDTALDSEG